MGILETIIGTVILTILIIIVFKKILKVENNNILLGIGIIGLFYIVLVIVNGIKSGEINIIEMIFKDW